MSLYIDLHILQSVPPSNLNRDDMGSPKTAVYGGARRARVSSQAWKRATRLDFQQHLEASDIGYRTARLVELIGQQIRVQDPSVEEKASQEWAENVLKDAGLTVKVGRASKKDPEAEPEAGRTEYLVFLSHDQIEKLARLALDAQGAKIAKRDAHEAANTDHSFDVALFGRMVADEATLNVDAAVQVAHALSTHAVDTEFDYYTAVDDKNPREETGAGMIGTVEFNSATLYRYATINVDMLVKNLGDRQAAARAARAFTDAFVRSMPSGKQNSFAHGTLPSAVVAVVRGDQPVSMVGAFENPVAAHDGGWITPSADRLGQHVAGLDAAYGDGRVRTLVTTMPECESLVRLGEQVDLPALVSQVEDVVASGS